MLELTDPLWAKLDAAYRDRDVPELLRELAVSWSEETASTLLHEMWHQGTCYGSTYAAIPHLLQIAEPEKNREQRREIAFFLAQVALDSRGQLLDDPPEGAALQGLPETLEGWDRTLDGCRSLVEMAESRGRPRSKQERERLSHFKELLSKPVNDEDLEKILSIKAEFYRALPAIRALCERTLLEWSAEKDPDEEAMPYLLSGIAAADGLIGMARLLNFGSDGLFGCASCGWGYEYCQFGERIAIYADDAPGTSHADRAVEDYQDGAPSRADGFLVPVADDDALDARIAALLSLAERAPGPVPALLVRHFAGSFVCCKCGVRGPMRAVR